MYGTQPRDCRKQSKRATFSGEEKLAIVPSDSRAPVDQMLTGVVARFFGEVIDSLPGPEFPALNTTADPAASTLSMAS